MRAKILSCWFLDEWKNDIYNIYIIALIIIANVLPSLLFSTTLIKDSTQLNDCNIHHFACKQYNTTISTSS